MVGCYNLAGKEILKSIFHRARIGVITTPQVESITQNEAIAIQLLSFPPP